MKLIKARLMNVSRWPETVKFERTGGKYMSADEQNCRKAESMHVIKVWTNALAVSACLIVRMHHKFFFQSSTFVKRIYWSKLNFWHFDAKETLWIINETKRPPCFIKQHMFHHLIVRDATKKRDKEASFSIFFSLKNHIGNKKLHLLFNYCNRLEIY